MREAGALPHARLVLPLLSFGAGADDAFALTALGGIFTANLTGNAILAAAYIRPHYVVVLAGALTAILSFAAALCAGFRITRPLMRDGFGDAATLTALIGSAACLKFVVALWWFAPHDPAMLLLGIAASAAAMALQTVATKRDGIARGATTTYMTGTLTDLLGDIMDGGERWTSWRWIPLAALPTGALVAMVVGQIWPPLMPLVPLGATFTCLCLISEPSRAFALLRRIAAIAMRPFTSSGRR